ncbi:MAG: hypothetical protein ACOYN0_06665 [Phycisphaerales bacterium]
MLATLLASAMLAASLAQADPSTQPADDAALAGPAVGEQARKSLLQRDFNGTPRRLELPAEEAALELLGLTPEQKSATDAVIADRRAKLDAIVAQNLDLLLKLKGSRDSGDAAGLRQHTRELLGKLGPIREKGRLLDQLAAVLPPEKAAQLRALTRDYWEMKVEEEVRGGEERSKARVKLMLAAVGLEIKRAYETRISGQQQDLDDLIVRLELSSEQEGKVRGLFLEFAQKTLGKATADQRAELFRDLNKILTGDQQARLIREIYAGGSERKVAPSK